MVRVTKKLAKRNDLEGHSGRLFLFSLDRQSMYRTSSMKKQSVWCTVISAKKLRSSGGSAVLDL